MSPVVFCMDGFKPFLGWFRVKFSFLMKEYGQSEEMKSLNPPIYFVLADLFKVIYSWSLVEVNQAIISLVVLDWKVD